MDRMNPTFMSWKRGGQNRNLDDFGILVNPTLGCESYYPPTQKNRPPSPTLEPFPTHKRSGLTVAIAHETSEPVLRVSRTEVSTAVVLGSQGSGGAGEALVV